MDAGALGRTAKRQAGKGIAIAAAGVAAAALLTASAGAATAGGATTVRLVAKAAAVVFISPCRACVTSVPAGIRTGAVADEYGALVTGRGTRVGHFATVITQVTPRELLVDATLVLGPGQIMARGVEAAAASGGTLAIIGGPAGTSPPGVRSGSATRAKPCRCCR